MGPIALDSVGDVGDDVAVNSKRKVVLRVALLVALLVGIVGIAAATGVRQRLSLDGVRAITASAGAWGAVAFVVVFCLGELIQIPGMIFIAAGILMYGRLWGSALAWAAALVSVSFTFAVVRGVGGRALGEIRHPLMLRVLARLDAAPVRTVFVARVLFQASPPINYALALSPMRYRDYLLGSAAGLAPPVVVAALFVDRLVAWVSAHP
jgi:uncharacterized membrane protein YdjX (TVP38/TMEM64 family)